jgi:hypothetical protein
MDDKAGLAAGMSPSPGNTAAGEGAYGQQWGNGGGNGYGGQGGFSGNGVYGQGQPVEKQGSSNAPVEMSSAGAVSEMSATREDDRRFVAELPAAGEMGRRS